MLPRGHTRGYKWAPVGGGGGGLSFSLCRSFHGLPWWLCGKEPTCKCRRCRFDPWVRKIPWRRKWQPIPTFLPGEPHRQRSLPGYSPWGFKGVGQDLATKQQQVSPQRYLNVLMTQWLASYRASGLRRTKVEITESGSHIVFLLQCSWITLASHDSVVEGVGHTRNSEFQEVRLKRGHLGFDM